MKKPTSTIHRYFHHYFFTGFIALFFLNSFIASNLSAQEELQVTPKIWTTVEDHQNMMSQLGITELRPGPSGNPDNPNAANTAEEKANPYPQLPKLLTLKNGEAIDTASAWLNLRRAEIVEDFEREVVGRLPANIPTVTWSVVEESTENTVVGGIPVIAQKLLGHVDNSAYPEINVDIQMTVVIPATATGPVPLLMMFGRGGLPESSPEPASVPRSYGSAFDGPSSTERLIAAGWGYAAINPTSIQADNGAGLTLGIIGLVNKGQPRKPDDWGALRAWAWGAAQGLDHLETLASIDSKRVGIEGVSRYGKAALVTHAFEPRFNTALIGSSGEGGAALYRRNFGEAVENLTSSGEYHWMAGNFLKYGTTKANFGSKNANDIPIDSHMLIALCAPRPLFISYGIPEHGDALWLDQQGSYMATVAASKIFRLLGAEGISDSNHYNDAQMPPVNVGLIAGELAWRQHNGGHEDRSNMQYFIEWANKY